ncbi:octopamine receptor beta-1R-like [Saccoglossus kowalevskii]|uniref:5-hydroxytryptamine receptor 4-like n=1 Tax=Saccoglossus kowalevskii TaxID=10224 RepID=A0ABM0LW46_SACKO|nr:PREDICTED: 5-hydroxytryptamine receptor 4-like [Saccoglossus kowalevskii]
MSADSRDEISKHIGSIFLIVIITLSITGNMLVIAAVMYSAKLREQFSIYFIVNLSLTDLTNATFVMPFATASFMNDSWSFGPLICEMNCALNYMCIITSMLTLCFIAVERYIAAVDTSMHRRSVTKKTILVIITFSWVQAFVFAIIPVASSWVTYDYWESVCAIDWNHGGLRPLVYVITAFILCFLLPSVIMSVAYIRLYRAVSNTCSINPSEKRIMQSLVVIVTLFLVCMSPFCVTKLIKICFSKYSIPHAVNTLATFMQFSASAVNPIIYAFFRRDLRLVFKRMLCFKRFAKVEPGSGVTTVFSLTGRQQTAKNISDIQHDPNLKQQTFIEEDMEVENDLDLDVFYLDEAPQSGNACMLSKC